jgi:hypothetical protein
MTKDPFPELDAADIRATRDALHAYSRLLGDLLKSVRPMRKHWWHASLRPSLNGLTTGVVHANVDVELELDFITSRLYVRSPQQTVSEELGGQPAAAVARWICSSLESIGFDRSLIPRYDVADKDYSGYSAEQAGNLHQALSSVAAALGVFRAGIREETSPIQVWPHHFDLSMIWLPGPKVPGQDPANEEYADKQMNFGFVFGDAGIEEPYLYVTAYPLPDEMPGIDLPDGTTWKSDGFSGAVLIYSDLIRINDPAGYLQQLWSTLLAAGQRHWSKG